MTLTLKSPARRILFFAGALAAAGAVLGAALPPIGALAAPLRSIKYSVADRDMPQRERELIGILQDARKRYDAADTVDAKRAVRLDMQVRIARFMTESQEARGWIGVVRSNGANRDGDAAIAIEIAPGILISTARNRTDDPNHVTLISRDSSLYDVVDKIALGAPILFSATIVRFLVASDDIMVRQPLLFARFVSLDADE